MRLCLSPGLQRYSTVYKVCLSTVTAFEQHLGPGQKHPSPPYFQMRKLRLGVQGVFSRDMSATGSLDKSCPNFNGCTRRLTPISPGDSELLENRDCVCSR